MKKRKSMNKKGFTMVELLGVIVIMGILATIAIPSVMQYIKRGRDTSFSTALKSCYEATENYMMNNDTSVVIAVGGSRTFQVQTLVDAGFLENIVDPSADGQLCSNRTESKVKVTRLADTTGGLPNYRYDVTLYCKNSGYRYYTFPNDGLMEPAYLAADKYMKAQKLAAPQTIALSTLISKGYLKNGDMKTASGSCNNANSKVVASSSGNTVLYTVQLKCGSDVLNAKFSV